MSTWIPLFDRNSPSLINISPHSQQLIEAKKVIFLIVTVVVDLIQAQSIGTKEVNAEWLKIQPQNSKLGTYNRNKGVGDSHFPGCGFS